MSIIRKVFRHRTKILGLLALAALLFGLVYVFEVPARDVLLMAAVALALMTAIIAIAFTAVWCVRLLSSRK